MVFNQSLSIYKDMTIDKNNKLLLVRNQQSYKKSLLLLYRQLIKILYKKCFDYKNIIL